MSANMGMACSACLQDAEVLGRACAAAAGDPAAAAARYNAARLRNVHILTRMTRELDGVFNFGYHGDVRQLLRGLPTALAYRSANLPPAPVLPSAALVASF